MSMKMIYLMLFVLLFGLTTGYAVGCKKSIHVTPYYQKGYCPRGRKCLSAADNFYTGLRQRDLS